MSLLNKIFPTEVLYKIETKRHGNLVGEVWKRSTNDALDFIPELTEEEKRQFEYSGVVRKQMGRNVVSITEYDAPIVPQKVYEARLRHDDPEMKAYHDEQHDNRKLREIEKEHLAGAPYAVGWSGQYMEWYGDDDPSVGKGRYKSKGDGGKMVAINVPTYQQAEQIEKEIENRYRNGTLHPHIDGKRGEDHALIHYQGPYIKSMNDLDQYEKIDMKHDQPEDYSQMGEQQ